MRSRLLIPEAADLRMHKPWAFFAFFLVFACAQGTASTHVAAHKPSAGASIYGSNTSAWTGQWLLVDDVLHGSTAVANALQQRAQRPGIPPSQDGSPSQGFEKQQQLQPSLRRVAMFVLVACTLILAAGGGMGGGAIFVPLYIVVGGFSTSQAVALSNITVLGGAVASLCCNLRRRHPSLPKPLIDWDLIMVMEPTTILGALLGSYMNKLLPVWVTSVLLASLLTLITVKLMRRAVKVAQAENAANCLLAQYREPLLQQQEEAERLLPPAAGGFGVAAAGGAGHPPAAVYVGGSPLDTPTMKAAHLQLSHHDLSVDLRTQSLLQQVGVMSKSEQRQVPVWPLVIMLLLAAAVVSSDSLKSQLPCGSWQYWLLVLSIVPLCGTVTLLVRRHLLRKAALRQRAGLVRGEGELCWNARNTILYPGICSTAGVVAGLFGVGGGIVKSPLMLELGVCPQVAAATSSTMIAFTAGSACVVYLNFGGLDTSVAVPLLGLGFLATLVGQMGTSYLVKALGRKSVIIFVMTALMFLSTLAAYYQAGVNVEWVAGHMDQIWNGGQICGGVTQPGR